MCDSTMCGFWVKLLLYLILGEYSFDIPHYTVPIQNWIKKEDTWGSQSTISLDKAVSVFVLYIQILEIWKWVLVTLSLNFEFIKFLSS